MTKLQSSGVTKSLPNQSRWSISPVWFVVAPTFFVIGLAFVATSIYLPGAMQAAAIDSAYRGNIEVADQIKITRGYYSSQIVAKALNTGALIPTFDHVRNPKAIPLPATFVKDISDLLQHKDTTLSLISPYPWPHRADRKMDDFQNVAWQAFQKDPEAVFSRQEIRDGKRVLRVAISDRMTGDGCVDCHNNDPQSIKKDWNVGDVRAVMEVTKTVEPYLASVEYRSRMIIFTLGVTALVVTLVLFFTARLVVRRVQEKQLADRHVYYLARHDALTGALNREAFGHVFSEGLARRSSDTALAVHYIDIDAFKEVNDNFGHATGDELIRAVVVRLRRVMNNCDVLARLGGDEFVMLQQNVKSTREAGFRASEIVRAISEPFNFECQQVCVSASVGVILSSDPQASAEELLKSADVALYRAKKEGRNRSVLFSPDMLDELQRRRDLEQRVRRAADGNLFELHFQPIWNVDGCELAGFEALLRLQDGIGDNISPAEFIPIAEQMGKIEAIGAWVIQEACSIAAAWPDHLSVAVNLSPLQFRSNLDGSGRISQIVREALYRSGLTPGRLELEVTEGLLLESNDVVVSELRNLKAMGVSLVMDDFGAGYSSLNYLWKFPFSKLKIDRGFVTALGSAGATVAVIVRTITTLARSLDMRVTVEGVETSEQVALFADLGCDQIQGFYLGRPMPVTGIAAAVLNDFCFRTKAFYDRPDRAVSAGEWRHEDGHSATRLMQVS